jgi:hypothetical protein
MTQKPGLPTVPTVELHRVVAQIITYRKSGRWQGAKEQRKKLEEKLRRRKEQENANLRSMLTSLYRSGADKDDAERARAAGAHTV